MPIELVTSAKILGLNRSDLKWNYHIDSLIKKAKKRLYSLSQLKRSGLGTRELVQFFCTCIRPVTEYVCPVFHDSLSRVFPMNLREYKRGLIKTGYAHYFPFPLKQWVFGYVESGLIKFSVRRQELVHEPICIVWEWEN